MISRCHCRVERWARVSAPVKEALQGLQEGFGRISSHPVFIVAARHAFYWVTVWVLRIGPVGTVPMQFSWEDANYLAQGHW